MAKDRRSRRSKQAFTPKAPEGYQSRGETSQLLDLFAVAKEGLLEAVIQAGLKTFQLMLEQDRTMLAGERSRPQNDRTAYRYGFDRGRLAIGGRIATVAKAGVRAVDGGELSLPTWEAFANQDPLTERVVNQIILGVSTRNYARSLEDVPEDLEVHGTDRSSVSRHFVARSQAQVQKYLERSLEGLHLPVVMVDGLAVDDRVILIALGIDITGVKHILSLVEGTTECTEVCKSLFSDLVKRGLLVEQPRLFVIDGGKGIRKAITKVFGRWALVQRCQVHKRRNVESHLPHNRIGWVRRQLEAAWNAKTYEAGLKKLNALAASLDESHPSAAGSIREGMAETLTILKLGIGSTLAKTLRSSNPIENMNGMIRKITKNVKRWRNGRMIIRWMVTAIKEAEKKFRRVRGYKDLPFLVASMQMEIEKSELSQEKVAV